jgi:hypothetical protein
MKKNFNGVKLAGGHFSKAAKPSIGTFLSSPRFRWVGNMRCAMSMISSPVRRPGRFGFATLAFLVVLATTFYALLLNQPWPS